jgi:hypothetical protein
VNTVTGSPSILSYLADIRFFNIKNLASQRKDSLSDSNNGVKGPEYLARTDLIQSASALFCATCRRVALNDEEFTLRRIIQRAVSQFTRQNGADQRSFATQLPWVQKRSSITTPNGPIDDLTISFAALAARAAFCASTAFPIIELAICSQHEAC